MIQRLQTIYLTLALIVMSFSFYFSFASFNVSEDLILSLNFNHLFLNNAITDDFHWNFPVSIFIIFILLSILSVIFLYKKMELQSRIGKLLYVLLLGYILFLYINSNNLVFYIEEFYQIKEVELLYLYSFYAPIVAVTFVFLANKAIKKDITLLKSLDRLR